MYMTVDLDSSVADVLAAFRGPIVAAEMAYPEILHVEVRDDHGELWRFATQDADWSPRDPAELHGLTLISSTMDPTTRELRCQLSNGSALVVTPAPQVESDDPPNWELITPSDLVLEVGPGSHWQIFG
jgi:hypothetical protein